MYVKAINGSVETFPYTIGNLRKDNKNVSFPRNPTDVQLAVYHVYPVTETTPTPEDYQVVVKSATPFYDNGWKLTHTLANKPLPTRKAELAALRYQKEIAGITFNSLPVPTDRETQAMLTGAYNAMQLDATMVIDWKTDNGFISLNKAAIEALSSAVIGHVQSCFTAEKAISALLDNDISTDITDGWD